jgi:hypothetical protein
VGPLREILQQTHPDVQSRIILHLQNPIGRRTISGGVSAAGNRIQVDLHVDERGVP